MHLSPSFPDDHITVICFFREHRPSGGWRLLVFSLCPFVSNMQSFDTYLKPAISSDPAPVTRRAKGVE
ncbi:hypothetical protein LWS69_01340 [Bordetella hinzii]|uniref:hypothetical protein n=1 Tax=Bordetella hinzii TaxID=103855 RepID=UPI0011873FCC|nr:hypothetical protein [Bordetella hinzii]MCJ9707677.1 hypothetical protein [Bordetella hinzii]